MANIYVRSTTGNDANSGATWALAKAKIAGACAIAVAGDNIFVSQAHAETTAGAITWNTAGTALAPTRILCVDDSTGEPPASGSLRTTATVSMSITATFTIGGSCYVYGISWLMGSAALAPVITLGATTNVQNFEECSFQLLGSGASSRLNLGTGSSGGSIVDLRNCTVKFASASHQINGSRFKWTGGSVLAGGTSPTVVFGPITTTSYANGLIENFDFSNCSAGVNLCNPPCAWCTITFRNCKVPTSWSGSPRNGSLVIPGRTEAYNVDDGATNYDAWVEDYTGALRSETSIIRTGGVTTPDSIGLSWKLSSTTTCIFPVNTLATPEINIWNATVGSAITVTVPIIRDSATNLKNNEVWLEVCYLGNSSFPIGTFVTSRINALDAASDLSSSSVTWAGTGGMANPNKQQVSVTFTPQMAGLIASRVVLGKASVTALYVDYLPVIS